MLMSNNRNKARIGEIVEYKATIWLLEQGFEVFKNVSSRGPIDLMCLNINTNAIIRVDVKKVTDGTRMKDVINIPHIKEQQKLLNVNLLYYDEKRDFFGWSIEEVYTNAGKKYNGENKIQRTREQVVFDKKFYSINEIADYYKINRHSLYERHRSRPLEPLEQSVSILLSRSRAVQLFGKVFSTKKDACREYNVNYHSVEERGRVKSETFEQAVQHFLDKKTKKETFLRDKQSTNSN